VSVNTWIVTVSYTATALILVGGIVIAVHGRRERRRHQRRRAAMAALLSSYTGGGVTIVRHSDDGQYRPGEIVTSVLESDQWAVANDWCEAYRYTIAGLTNLYSGLGPPSINQIRAAQGYRPLSQYDPSTDATDGISDPENGTDGLR
jgi:hypothetical protein